MSNNTGRRRLRGLGEGYTSMQERNKGNWDPEYGQPDMPASTVTRREKLSIPPAKRREIEIATQAQEKAFQHHLMFSKRPANLDPPPNSDLIDLHTNPIITIAAGGTLAVLQITVQPGTIVVLKSLGIEIEAPAAFPLTQWRVLAYGLSLVNETQWLAGAVAQQTLFNFNVPVGTLNNPYKFEKTLTFKSEGAVVMLEADNNDVAPHDYEARMTGWQYPYKNISSNYKKLSEYLI